MIPEIKAHRIILSACSSISKEILQINTNNNHPVIYLRGILHSEMMSILQFIYLGEAKCYKERMKEFLTVAKILDIQALAEGNEEDKFAAEYEEDEYIKKEESPIPVEDVEPGQLDIDGAADSQNKTNSRAVIEGGHDYKCKLCAKTYNTSFILKRHIQSVHVGVKYACNQCDFQTGSQSHLTTHIKAKHEGIKYACNQCDYQATTQGSLRKHIKRKHL